MHSVETYVRELHDIRATGAAVAETSYYGALTNLLNAVGRTLKPPVRCVSTIKNVGAGIPDGGLFTVDQLQRGGQGEPFVNLLPARGAIEVKGTSDQIANIAISQQVRRYLERYGQVLVTNYRDFVLVGRDVNGNPATLEAYSLAPSEQKFWNIASDPASVGKEHGERLMEYLTRVMLHPAPLQSPEDLARFLASYARDARARVERGDVPALRSIRDALQQALGIRFEGTRGEHFFRSTLVQTLFYGIFAAWVLWNKQRPTGDSGRFDWRLAVWTLQVPMIRALFEQMVIPSTMQELDLVEVLDWTADVLNRVDRSVFFTRFEEEQAVQYFYEPFLQAFDPQLRRDLGVWYTPVEIIQYMVARVDTVLREELGVADGLADSQVYILDPCCGTGGYLVEVLKHIAATLQAKGGDALGGQDLKRAATERVFGFELLPAPFVIAHLQLGLLLDRLGASLSVRHDERAAVYLTNALTGWESPSGSQQRLLYPELEEERDAAEAIKRTRPILVVIGNPPYNGLAGVAVAEERDLSNAYRTTRRAPAPQGHGLNDLYVRFFRMAERRIVEGTGRGIVCLISNYSWLDGLSHSGMRERYLDAFDHIWIDNLNGDRYKTGKVTPEGAPDPSVFSTSFNPEGIQVGTAITTLVRTNAHHGTDMVEVRQFWGQTKRAQLLETAITGDLSGYKLVIPPIDLGLPFTTGEVGIDYLAWPLLPDVFPQSYPGIKTSRDGVVVDIDRLQLVHRMEQYFDPRLSHMEMQHVSPGAMENTTQFQAEATRDHLRKRGFLSQNVVRYCYRPFDVRWLYWEPETRLVDRNRKEYVPHIFAGNIWLAAVQQNRKPFDPPLVSPLHCSLHVVERGANLFPLYLRQAGQADLFSASAQKVAGPHGARPNLSSAAMKYLQTIGTAHDAPELFYHMVAILHAPTYRIENDGALRQDWPRVPLPIDRAHLLQSAALGRELAALLNTERTAPGMTAPDLRTLALITRTDGGQIDPDAGELDVTVNWGYMGHEGAIMPGRGRLVVRPYTDDERTALELGAMARGLPVEEVLRLLGDQTCDIYLNEVAYWKNIPIEVWGYTIGGYQAIKKWLSYRERDVLGRTLTPDEVREITGMARRIAAMLLLSQALDANYAAVKLATYPWERA